jgi:hypothetical protein
VVLALARAEVAVDWDFGRGTDYASGAIAGVLGGSWELELLRFRKDYSVVLFQGGDRKLKERARALIDTAPDGGRLAAAHFWVGAMADNVDEEPVEACAHYRIALELAEECGDELLMAQALRHLGHHAHAAGDLALARSQWERSTELLQKAGHLRPALAQQACLALLLRDEGDLAGARALASETNRWARQLGIPFIVQQTAELMESA